MPPVVQYLGEDDGNGPEFNPGGVYLSISFRRIRFDEGKILKEGSPKSLTRELGSAGITIKVSDTNIDLGPYLTDYKYTIDDSRLYFSVKDPDQALPQIIKYSYQKMISQN